MIGDDGEADLKEDLFLDVLQRIEDGAKALRGARKRPKVRINRSVPAHQAGRSRRDGPFEFEVFGPDHPDVVSGARRADDALVAAVKSDLNASGLTRVDILNSAAADADRLGEVRFYNMEYGLRTRSVMSLETALRWMEILGRELVIVTQHGGGGWFDSLLELRGAVLDGSPREVLEGIARSSEPE
jgi:hypothetical protein